MSGQVLHIKTKEGDTSNKGNTVIVLSAMKVRNIREKK
jgi:biotin carboxyl carrier protein